MMNVDRLIKELEDIVNNASSVPLTNKVMVDGEEVISILNEIEKVLPDEIKQARWIQNERDRILTEAKKEYETVVNDAKRHAEALVDKNEVLSRSRKRSEELMKVTDENIRKMKMGTYDYIDNVLYNFQEQMVELNKLYEEMFSTLNNSFDKVEKLLVDNREEIKDRAYKTQMNKN